MRRRRLQDLPRWLQAKIKAKRAEKEAAGEVARLSRKTWQYVQMLDKQFREAVTE